jgi:hypothetical protein
MYISETKNYLNTLLANPKIPSIMLWGKPGIGKSAIIKQICAEKDWGFIDLRLLLLNPIDLRGLPCPNHNTRKTDWLPPSFLPDILRDGVEGVILYDEITSAPPAVQAAAYQMILDRQVGEYKLPNGWRQVAAGNRAVDKGVVNRMPAPLANRMIHFEVDASLDDWKEWAIPNNIHHQVISFLNFRPELLYKFPDNVAEIKAFPSPRSWEFVSTILPMFASADKAFPAFASAVGEGVATEFTAFINTSKELPDPDEILSGKIDTVPDKPDMIYALIGVLIHRLVNKKTTVRLKNFFNYVINLPVEFQVLAVRDGIKAELRSDMITLPNFRNWVEKHAEYF